MSEKKEAIKVFDEEVKETALKLSDYAGAIGAFGKAIELDNHFPDAYYGKGVAYIMNGQLSEGLSNLSQAGEYGLYSAYNLIKKYSNEKK